MPIKTVVNCAQLVNIQSMERNANNVNQEPSHQSLVPQSALLVRVVQPQTLHNNDAFNVHRVNSLVMEVFANNAHQTPIQHQLVHANVNHVQLVAKL